MADNDWMCPDCKVSFVEERGGGYFVCESCGRDNKMPHGGLIKVLRDLGEEIVEINTANGWRVTKPEDWPAEGDPELYRAYKIPAIIALIQSEASEALEAFRKDDKENFIEELADVVIRVLDCASGLKMDLARAIIEKLAKNRLRAHRHGGKKI